MTTNGDWKQILFIESMLRICTEFLQKTTCEQLLSFLIYNVTYRHEDRQKETNRRGSFNIIHIYKSGKKSNFQWTEFRGFFLDICIYFVIRLQLKSGCCQKCLGSCQFLLAYFMTFVSQWFSLESSNCLKKLLLSK